VFTLRPTARLARRLKHAPALDTPPATMRLGDWYANLVHVGRQQLVLAISEKTLLPLVVPAAPVAGLADRIRARLGEVLTAYGIEREVIEGETAAMAEIAYGKTTSRQLLGVLVELARLLPFDLEQTATLLETSLRLAETPCGPLYKTAHSFPDRTTVALLAGDELARVHRSGFWHAPRGGRATKAPTVRALTAYHEAGHAVMCGYFGSPPHRVSIRPGEHTLGRSLAGSPGPGSLAAVYLAGFAAEHVLLGRRPEQLDHEITFALLARRDRRLGAAFEGAGARDGTRALQALLAIGADGTDQELRREVDQVYEATRDALDAEWPRVEAVAAALLERGELDREAFEGLVGASS